MTPSSYIMIGGFLGAGKTTAMLRLADYLTARGRRVGLITNDQSHGLVDTSVVQAHGYPVQEITGGCFCCRFNSLTDAAEQLTRDAQPDVFLAEPVGSCTDLRATVQYPLSRMYGDQYAIAPLSVLVDPFRALRILGVETGRSFSPKVLYVYDKQLEEADLIVINKSDLITTTQSDRLRAALLDRYPAAAVINVSARTGSNLEEWFGRILDTPLVSRPSMDVDYDIYADGEALLGWLNGTAQLRAASPFDGNGLLRELADRIHGDVAVDGFEIAHLKMTLTPGEGSDIAALNLVRTDGRPELSHHLVDETTEGELIVNLRAEGDPARLRTIVETAVRYVAAAHGADAAIVHCEHFRPARPQPTHRLAAI
jgi:Ni2+-binding GTPase involved in maturation of urease and hydrogenase